MKKFKFKIRGNSYDVLIQSIEDKIAEIEVNGTHYQVEIEKEMQTTKTPKLVRAHATTSSDSTKTEKTRKPTASKGGGEVKAPLPGTIMEIKKKVGDEVKAGDTLLIMEAMKMENDINADKSGKISEIKVNNGDSVLEGDVLVVIGGN
jgi:biotin carboxyl carrier protein